MNELLVLSNLKNSEIKAFAIKNDAGPLMNTKEDEDNRTNVD